MLCLRGQARFKVTTWWLRVWYSTARRLTQPHHENVHRRMVDHNFYWPTVQYSMLPNGRGKTDSKRTLYPALTPSVSHLSSATRSAMDTALILRGWKHQNSISVICYDMTAAMCNTFPASQINTNKKTKTHTKKENKHDAVVHSHKSTWKQLIMKQTPVLLLIG